MTLLQQLQQAAQNARKGLPASITAEADGVQYTRNFLPRERLILLGGGNIAQPLCQYASDLGFDVVVVDDRPSFANAARFPRKRLRASCATCFRRPSPSWRCRRMIMLPSLRAATAMMLTVCVRCCAERCRATSA